MKKIIAVVVAAVSIAAVSALTVAAVAPANSGTAERGRFVEIIREKIAEKRTQRKAAKSENREELAIIKEDIKVILDATKTLRDTNIELAKQNRALSAELKAELKAIRDSGDTLDDAVTEQLAVYREELKALRDEQKATKGSARDIIKANYEAIKNGDAEVISEVTAQITVIQNERAATLSEINQIISDMLTLVKG